MFSFPSTVSMPASATARASLLCCCRIEPIRAEEARITMAKAPSPRIRPTATASARANPACSWPGFWARASHAEPCRGLTARKDCRAVLMFRLSLDPMGSHCVLTGQTWGLALLVLSWTPVPVTAVLLGLGMGDDKMNWISLGGITRCLCRLGLLRRCLHSRLRSRFFHQCNPLLL